jgi:hypothetical protein
MRMGSGVQNTRPTFVGLRDVSRGGIYMGLRAEIAR